ncbi:DUF6241 domain-containing protein [Rossellomorea sp. DA94]|uniref:DUF6241 domain-containing protein n=1 Tax=Rossellomorea sp. DA94 TaxID=3038653 RepID=UPI00244CB5EB|nr:DUF6241 domain-containing protein [Rossellomorea sp. DA94]WGG45425.1 DUF6241 domain-containing protein [Rossellomorea sp. DA94]
MSRKTVGIIIGSVLLLTALGVYIAVGTLNMGTGNGGGADRNAAGGTVERTTGVEMNDDEEDGQKVSEGGNPFGEEVKTPLSEKLMQQYIHAMSHQKVAAKEKWSFFQITDERIEYLLNQLEINQYQHESTYEDILKSWKEGDFSDAVSDHNTIWRIQDGTVGKATSLLSPKEEEAYLNKQKTEKR